MADVFGEEAIFSPVDWDEFRCVLLGSVGIVSAAVVACPSLAYAAVSSMPAMSVSRREACEATNALFVQRKHFEDAVAADPQALELDVPRLPQVLCVYVNFQCGLHPVRDFENGSIAPAASCYRRVPLAAPAVFHVIEPVLSSSLDLPARLKTLHTA